MLPESNCKRDSFQGAVNVRNILISKIGRLSNYAQADPNNIPEDIKLFEIFSGKVTQIIQVCLKSVKKLSQAS